MDDDYLTSLKSLDDESVKSVKSADRFEGWQYPVIEEGKPTKYNWVVQHVDNFKLGYKTDIGAFTYINAKCGVTIEDDVQIGSHRAIYSVSTIDGREERGAGGAEERVPNRDAHDGNAGGDCRREGDYRGT